MDNIDPEQLAEAKIQEMRKEFVAVIENSARKETENTVKKEAIEKAIRGGKLSIEEIAEYNDVTADYVMQIKKELKKIE